MNENQSSPAKGTHHGGLISTLEAGDKPLTPASSRTWLRRLFTCQPVKRKVERGLAVGSYTPATEATRPLGFSLPRLDLPIHLSFSPPPVSLFAFIDSVDCQASDCAQKGTDPCQEESDAYQLVEVRELPGSARPASVLLRMFAQGKRSLQEAS